MKKFLVGLGKVLIWLGFFINLGIKELFKNENSSKITMYGFTAKRQVHPREDEGRFSARMTQWEQTKIVLAQKKVDSGGVYSISDYFADLKEYTDSVLAFGQEPVGLFFMSRLQHLSIQNGLNEDVDAVRERYFPEMVAEEKRSAENFPTWKEIGSWWFCLYLKTFPLAFLLFLLWVYQANEYKSFRLRNPLSFLFSLAIYPFVIGFNVIKWWRNAKREFSAEYEIRRAKDKIFHLLSEDEVALVKRFAKSNIRIKEFREQLRLKGYVPKYRLAPILFAMFLMSLIPARGLATSANFHKQGGGYHIEKMEYFCCSDPSPGDTMQYLEPIASDIVTLLQEVQYLFYLFISAPCRGHNRGIDHVPLVVKSNSTRKTFNHQKNKYETIYCSYCIAIC